MSDERIDIEINDKIDPSIAKKLREIKTSADQGSLSVKKLKADLVAINASPVKTLAAETSTATTAINKQLAAQNTLTTATTRSNAATVKAAASAVKNTAAIDAEAAAQARLAAVIDRTIARQKAQEAANGATALGSGATQLVGSRAAFAAQAASINAASKEVQAATLATEAVTVGSFGRIKNSAMNMYDFLRDASVAQAARFRGFFGAGGAATIEKEAVAVGKLGTHAKGSSTAIRELFVLAREAGRGDFTRMAGSASILAGALGLMNTVMIPTAILLGTIAAGMKLFEESIRAKADPTLKAYANTLGLTHKEMRKLGDETVNSKGKLEEFNVVTLTFGDVFNGLKKTIEDSLDLDPALKRMKSAVYDAAVQVASALGDAAAEIYATMRTAYDLVTGAWSKFPFTMKGFFKQMANEGVQIFEDMINDVIAGINKLDKLLGGTKVIPKVTLPKFSGNDVTPWGTDIVKFAKQDSTRYYNEFKKGEQTFLQDWKKNSIQAGKDRLKALADAIKDNRNPHTKKPTDPKTKDDYLTDTNKKLDDELSRMHLLKDAREEQQRLDQIEEEFIKRRMPLTASEIAGFKTKIHAIQEFKYQQVEMDRIYEAATGPLRTYNAAQAAAKDLLDQGAISAQRYSQELVKANRAYQEAIDPLFALKEAMTTNEVAAKLYGDQVQANNYYETIRQQLLSQGIVLSQQYVAGQNAEVDVLMRKNAALQQQLFVQSQLGSILQPILDEQKTIQNKQAMYDELERLRQADLQHEDVYQRARYALDAKYTELRLSGARGFFSTLAGLSSSGNKKLAAIGKAAAIATATIDGIVAVQKALASAPPPWNIIQAAAIAAMTGLNIAKILSTNTAGYATGGLVTGAGNGTSDSIHAMLSNGEFVLTAKTVRRLGVSKLNALNNGDIPALATGGLVGSATPLSVTKADDLKAELGSSPTVPLWVKIAPDYSKDGKAEKPLGASKHNPMWVQIAPEKLTAKNVFGELLGAFGGPIGKVASKFFANGGEFIVDGKAGVDQNNVSFHASKGERVRVETPAQQRASDRRNGATHVTVNPKIVNVFDKRELLAVLNSQEGDDLILNVISRNPNAVAGMIGR